MGKFRYTYIIGFFTLICNAQNITIKLDDQQDSIPISRITNRVGEIKLDGLRFKLVVWSSYYSGKHLVIRDKSGTFGYQQIIKQKDGVVVAFIRKLKKIPIIKKQVKL